MAFWRSLFLPRSSGIPIINADSVYQQVFKESFNTPMYITSRNDIPEQHVRKDFGMIVGCHTTTANYFQNSYDRVLFLYSET